VETLPFSLPTQAWGRRAPGTVDGSKNSSGSRAGGLRRLPSPTIAGERWADAAAEVRDALGVSLETVVIGPGRAVTDLYYDWARLREVEEDGVLLVRPDKHIGWRSATMPAEPAAALRRALTAILAKEPA
jgi:hypothetical protein